MWERTKLAEKSREPDLNDQEDVEALKNSKSDNPLIKAMGELYFRIPWTVCPGCKKSWNELTEFDICIACLDKRGMDEQRQVELGRYLKMAIGSYGIERYSFESYKTDAGNFQAFVHMRDFNFHTENIFIHGDTGTGKTHLAGAALKKACGQNLTVAWLQPLYVGRSLRGKFPAEEEALIEEWVRKDVVIIDDLGVGRDLDVTLRMVYELIDKRQKQKKNGLIISSNHDLDKLAKSFKDVRIISRVKGLCRVIPVIGVDKRMENDR